jgi:hypothetical protein
MAARRLRVAQPMSPPARSETWNGPIGKPNLRTARSIWYGDAPSSIMWSAAARYIARMRLPMKPSHTPARTGTLRSFFARSKAVATTSALTCAGTTTSSSFIMFAGEKKCRPTTSPGRETLAAIASTSRYEVLVASTAPGLQTRSSSANTACLTAMSSNTASITISTAPSES